MTSRRRTALVLAIAMAVAAILWWMFAAPATGTRADASAVADSDVDLDPPALRARRDAAVALAKAPDDPWTLAESLAASAPASQADAASLCGNDERPQFAPPQGRGGPPVETRGAGPHYREAQARVDAALRGSADPFDRAVADWLDVGQMRTPEGRVDAVAQAALAGDDPRVYALALRTCRRAPLASASCGALTPGRWAELDPDNGVPWLYVLDAARRAGDTATQDAALARLAAASRFDDRSYAAAGAVAARAPDDDASLAAVADLSVQASTRSLSQVVPIGSLLGACRADASHAQQCQAISDGMFDRSDTLILRTLGAALQVGLNRDDSRRKLVRAEIDQAGRTWSPAIGFSSCGAERDLLADMRRKAEVGDLQALRERVKAPQPP